MTMRALIIYILLAVVFFSCDEPFVLDPDQAQSQIVIEGLVTDIPGKQAVKISMTGDFYSTGPTARVTDATVAVTDDLGNTVNFVHNPHAHPDSAGIYLPEVAFTGEIGRTYSLKVEAHGQTYQAHDKLVKVIPVDSLTYRINEDEQANPDNEGKIYEIKMYAREDQSTHNFYLFKFYQNDSLVFDSESDIYYSDDELLAENIDGIPAPVYYRYNDSVKMEIYSMSREAYVYYNDLSTLLNNDSGMFGPIPASPRTNLSNNALGLFQVSSVGISTTKIE
jgi:hypothetical protein